MGISCRLLNPDNLMKCDVLLCLVAPTQAEHALRAKYKVTPEQHVAYKLNESTRWRSVLTQTMARATHHAPSLVSMGILFEVDGPAAAFAAFEEQSRLSSMIMDFAICLVGERG